MFTFSARETLSSNAVESSAQISLWYLSTPLAVVGQISFHSASQPVCTSFSPDQRRPNALAATAALSSLSRVSSLHRRQTSHRARDSDTR